MKSWEDTVRREKRICAYSALLSSALWSGSCLFSWPEGFVFNGTWFSDVSAVFMVFATILTAVAIISGCLLMVDTTVNTKVGK